MNQTIPSSGALSDAAKGLYFAFQFSLVVGAGCIVDSGTGAQTLSAVVRGTGGEINKDNIRGFGDSAFDLRSVNQHPTVAIDDDIQYIKGALKITTSDLARYLGVSRTAIYDWKSGASIKSHNISKLENLRGAADVIVESGMAISSLQLNRKLPGDATMLQAIEAGHDGAATAHALVSLLQKEAENRQEIRKRFAGRKPISNSEFANDIAGLREDG